MSLKDLIAPFFVWQRAFEKPYTVGLKPIEERPGAPAYRVGQSPSSPTRTASRTPNGKYRPAPGSVGDLVRSSVGQSLFVVG